MKRENKLSLVYNVCLGRLKKMRKILHIEFSPNQMNLRNEWMYVWMKMSVNHFVCVVCFGIITHHINMKKKKFNSFLYYSREGNIWKVLLFGSKKIMIKYSTHDCCWKSFLQGMEMVIIIHEYQRHICVYMWRITKDNKNVK